MPANWLADARLWLVLDRAAAQPRSLIDVTRECIAGGADAVVFRAKDLSPEEALEAAIPVRRICASLGVPFVLAHFVDLAAQLNVDAVHLGKEDGPMEELRGHLPIGVVMGYSAHSIAEVESAIPAGADYAFLGPIFPTPSKLQYGEPLGLDVVAQAAALPRPVVLIGGINAATLPRVLAAGGTRIAAISALQAVDDPRSATAELKQLLDDA